MKKTLILIWLLIILAIFLVSCGDIGSVEYVDGRAIVINRGNDSGCSDSNSTVNSWLIKIFIEQNSASETMHSEVIDEAVEPTCTSIGFTEGKHCSECNAVIVEQQEIPMKPHVVVIEPAVAPTCTQRGYTEGSYCSECNTIFTEQTVISEVGHSYDDEDDMVCNECGYSKTDCTHLNQEKVLGQQATCTSTGFTDGKNCVDCGKIIVIQEIIPLTDHIDGDWIIDKPASATEEGRKHLVCKICGNTIKEETIPKLFNPEYSVNSDGESCTVTGVGDFSGTDVYIPEYIDGYKVVSIGEGAFANVTHIKFIHIPDTVTSISRRAFFGCTGLTEITIPESVTSIGNQVFYKASNLSTVYYNSTYSDMNNPFLHLSHIKKVVFGGDWIPSYILDGCTNIQEVVILDVVKEIRIAAFQDCSKLTTVYYGGTVQQWSNISIGLKNTEIETVNKYYYSEVRPNDTDNGYWHYFDGEPTLW